MSSLPPPPLPDDPLALAEAAFRQTAVPEGPSSDVIARTLAVLTEKSEKQTAPWMRRKSMFLILRIAAAVLVAGGGFAYLAFHPSAAATEFAATAQKLREAHSISYTATVESAEFKIALTSKFLFKEPNLFRTEVPGGIVTIIDTSVGKQLILNPANKTALLLEAKPAVAPSGQAGGVGLIGRLRQLTEGDAKPVGEKAIGNIQARGYQVTNLGTPMTIWIDPASRLPIRFESSDRVQGKEIHLTATDFKIDPEIDDALFRTDPPAGYALSKGQSPTMTMDDKTFLNPEKATEAFLRIFAAKSGGVFPKRLDDPGEFDKVFPKKKVGELPDAETLGAVQSLARVLMATKNLKGGFGYKSDGVKLGDADKILFWYRPEGATQYRALYGDLHAADLSEDKLPEKPKP